MKYNPAFLTDDQLVAAFVVRKDELATLSEWLRDIVAGQLPAHIFLRGQRGSGKTTLARRLALEARNDAYLKTRVESIVLHEELFEVNSIDDLWREVDFHGRGSGRSARNVAPAEGSISTSLAGRFRSEGKRLLLVVENLYSLLTEQLGPKDVESLKLSLHTEADWLTLVATTTASRDEIREVLGQSIESFREHELSRLTPAECTTLIASISRRPYDRNKIRPIEILTGGNPRLISIMATFAQTRSLRELMQQLTHLIDEHTSYFKSNLESLPPYERRVFVALAGLWTPSPTAEVARASGLDVNRTSVYLTRLMSRGLVQAESTDGKGRRFQVAERLYNIYYLLRRSGRSAMRVRALVDFMLAFYTPAETIASVSHEACEVEPADRETYFLVVETLLGSVAAPDHAKALISAVDPAFFDVAPASFRAKYAALVALSSRSATMPSIADASEKVLRARLNRAPRDVNSLVRLAGKLAITNDSKPAAVTLLKQAAEISPTNVDVLFSLASLQFEMGDAAGAVRISREVVRLKPEMAPAWLLLAIGAEVIDDIQAAEKAYCRAAELEADNWRTQFAFATFLHERLANREAAVALLQRTVSLGPDAADPFLALSDIFEELGDFSQAEAVLSEGLERLADNATIPDALGHLYYDQRNYSDARTMFLEAARRTPSPHYYQMASAAALRLSLLDDAEQLAREALKLGPKDARSLIALGEAIRSRGDIAEAETFLRRAVAESPQDAFAHHVLGHVYEEQRRWSEANIEFSEAVRLAPDDDGAWRHLALALEHLGRDIDAREAYRRGALTVPDDAVFLFVDYIRMAVRCGDTLDVIVIEVDAFLQVRGRDAQNLERVARALLRHAGDAAAPIAERFSREAALLVSGNHDALLTLSEALAAQSKWSDATKYIAAVLSDSELVRKHHERILQLMIRLSTSVEIVRLHALLAHVDDTSSLAPLRTAFELILGQRPTVPQEMYLVADDVKRAIEAATSVQRGVLQVTG